MVLVAVVLAAFLLKGRTETLDELTVKRINIVDETGNIPASLTDRNYHHGKGLPVSSSSTPLAMNAEVWFTRKYGLQLWDYPKDNMFHERMERFKEWEDITDPNIRLKLYNEMKADGLLMEDRLFLGKDFNKDVGLFIKDSEGNVRIKIYVNQDNTPVIALYDKYGNLMNN